MAPVSVGVQAATHGPVWELYGDRSGLHKGPRFLIRFANQQCLELLPLGLIQLAASLQTLGQEKPPPKPPVVSILQVQLLQGLTLEEVQQKLPESFRGERLHPPLDFG
jgi:hypothetical protein